MDLNYPYNTSPANFVITREWIFQKVIHCIQTRNTAKTCGLLIIGGSGSGKTSICRQISSENKKSSCVIEENRLKNMMLSSYYCDRFNADSLSLTNFILHLQKSILYCSYFQPIFQEKLQSKEISQLFNIEFIKSNPDKTFKNGIILPLLSMKPPKENMFILIDSIDADLLSNSFKSRRFSIISDKGLTKSESISDLLIAHHNLFPEWLSLICTCKHDSSNFIKKFMGFRKFHIDDLSKSYVVRDIQFYILTRIDCDAKLKRIISSQESEILHILHIKSNGYILYLEIILDLISSGLINNISTVKSVPGTISGLYLWLFDYLFGDYDKLILIKHIFSVIMASLAPISEREMFNVLLNYDNSLEFPMLRNLMVKIKYFLVKTPDQTYKIKHDSLAEWLVDIKMSTPKYKCSLADGHALLALYFIQNIWKFHEYQCVNFVYHMILSSSIFQLKPYHYAVLFFYSNCQIDIQSNFNLNLNDCELENVILQFLSCVTNNLDRKSYDIYAKAVDNINRFYSRKRLGNVYQDVLSLHELARKNDLVQIQQLLARQNNGNKLDVNRVNSTGTTALMIAAQKGYESICVTLLEHGAQIDLCDSDEWTALRLAIWNGHSHIVRMFLSSGLCRADYAGNDGRTALRTAAWVGNLEIIRILLEHSANINQADSEGRTALMAATYRGNYHIVKYLVGKGADINHCDNDGRNALFVAVLCLTANPQQQVETQSSDPDEHTNKTKLIRLLLKHSIDVNHVDLDGMSAMSIAAYEGNAAVCEMLLEYGADINFIDLNSRTALMAAALSGHLEVVQLLLFWGSPVHCLDKLGFSVLSICACQGNPDILQVLLARGLDEMHRDNRGFTPLHLAASEGHITIVDMLLKSGARPNETDDLGRIPLMLACQEGHCTCVELLLDVWPHSLHFKSLDGSTALKIAIINDWTDIIQLLLTQVEYTDPSFIYLQDSNGRFTLHLLVLQGQTKYFNIVLDICIEHNPDIIDLQDEDGRTALHLASWKGDAQMVYRLLKIGHSNPGICDAEGRTALHLAAWQGRLEECRLLLRYNSDIDACCNQGATPLCIAAQEGHLDICQLLIAAGANIYHADDFNRTPYKVAFKGSHLAICKLLEKQGALLFLKN